MLTKLLEGIWKCIFQGLHQSVLRTRMRPSWGTDYPTSVDVRIPYIFCWSILCCPLSETRHGTSHTGSHLCSNFWLWAFVQRNHFPNIHMNDSQECLWTTTKKKPCHVLNKQLFGIQINVSEPCFCHFWPALSRSNFHFFSFFPNHTHPSPQF